MIAKILNFIKIEHTAFSLPTVLVGAWLGAGDQWPSLRVIGLIIVAATGARVFGMSFNRIFDRRIDALNPRTAARELPAGTMSLSLALVIALCALAVYLAACAMLGRWCLWLSPVPLIPLLGYSLLKRYTVLCHFGIGLCLALAPLGAFVAAAGHIHFSDRVWLFSAFVFFLLSGSDIIYAILDIQFDRAYHIHSIPARLGAGRAQLISAACHGVALACLAGMLVVGRAGWQGWSAFGLTLALFILMYLQNIPVHQRFFPIASLAGVSGALTALLI